MEENHHHHRHVHHDHDYDENELPEGRLALFWIMGALAIFGGSWISGHLEKVVGTSDGMYYGTMFIALIMILFGGLAWIGVAVSVAHHKG